MARDFVEKEEPEVELTAAAANELGKKISGFTMKLMQSMSSTDPQTGKRMMNLEDKSFEIMLQREKDLFFLQEGYSTEYVSKVIRENKANEAALN